MGAGDGLEEEAAVCGADEAFVGLKMGAGDGLEEEAAVCGADERG